MCVSWGLLTILKKPSMVKLSLTKEGIVMILNRTYAMKRGLRHIGDFTLYPTELDVVFGYNPRLVLYERSPILLWHSEEFELQMLRSNSVQNYVRWNLPLYFSVYEFSHRVSRGAEEWEKLQLLNTLGSRSGSYSFFQPWMPLAIYTAHRKGIIASLAAKEGSYNTFYVQTGLSTHAIDIEYDDQDKDTAVWRVSSRGMGDDQLYPDRQRVFVMR